MTPFQVANVQPPEAHGHPRQPRPVQVPRCVWSVGLHGGEGTARHLQQVRTRREGPGRPGLQGEQRRFVVIYFKFVVFFILNI